MTQPWSDLGIGPTDDRGAIRRAYAAKLKAIDVDADPDAFVALRHSYDWASHLAAHAAEPADLVLADDDRAEGDLSADDNADLFSNALPADGDVDVVASQGAETPVDISPEAQQRSADVDRLNALVYGDLPRADIYDEVAAITGRLLADPEMERIEFANSVELWMAQTIVHGIPRTNAMLAPAITYFGWDRTAEEWHCPPIIRQVIDRHRDCLFVDQVADQPGPLGYAFRVLSSPAGSNVVSGYNADAIADALATIRTYHPTAEYNLDPKTVGVWEAFLERRAKSWGYRARIKGRHYVGRIGSAVSAPIRYLWWIGFFLIALVRFISALPDNQSAAPVMEHPTTLAQPALTDERKDIDRAIGLVFSEKASIADVDDNPSLYALLRALWEEDRNQAVSSEKFTSDVSILIDKQLHAAVLNASYTNMANLQRARIMEAEYLRSIDPQACADMFEGRKVAVALPDPIKLTIQQTYRRILFDTPVKPGPLKRSDQVLIPGSVILAASALAKIDPNAFRDALDHKGAADQRCKVHIMLIKALLEGPPKQALPILRGI